MSVERWEKIIAGIMLALFGVAEFTIGNVTPWITAIAMAVAGPCGDDGVCGVDDAIGWFLFVLGIALVGVLIRFLWMRSTSSGDKDLPGLLRQLEASERRSKQLEAMLERLLEKVEKTNREIKKENELREELRRLVLEHQQLRAELEEKNVIDVKPETPLLVAIGSDAKLKLDLASLRAVRTDTGMQFTRIEDASLEKIKQHLDRARINGRPIDKLHLAVHSGPDGVYLSNTVIDSVRLSEILDGVRILLIAGCESDTVADYLGVVNYVVSMTEEVSHSDASLFARAFWEEIGRKQEPTTALRLALKRAPSGMSEFVEYHW